MAETPQQAEIRPTPVVPERGLTGAERKQQRIELAWERIKSGEDKVGQLFVDTVTARIENPLVTFAGRMVYKELKTAKTLAEAEDSDITTKKKALQAIYGRIPLGLKKLNAMSDEQVMEEAANFAQIAARELYLQRYLDRAGVKLQTQQELIQLCGVEKLSRREITLKAIQASREKGKTHREVNRLKSRLGLTVEEDNQVRGRDLHAVIQTALEIRYQREKEKISIIKVRAPTTAEAAKYYERKPPVAGLTPEAQEFLAKEGINLTDLATTDELYDLIAQLALRIYQLKNENA